MARPLIRAGEGKARDGRSAADDPFLEGVGNLWDRIAKEATEPEKGAVRLGFCSLTPGEGTTTIAANFALTCGKRRIRTALLDGNWLAPALASVFEVKEAPGLAEYLAGEADLNAVLRPKVAPFVDLVPGGSSRTDPTVPGNGATWDGLLGELDALEDLIVLDLPPLGGAPGTVSLLSKSDRVVLVVRSGRIRDVALQKAVEKLRKRGIRIEGVVLNDVVYELPVLLERNL